MSMKVFQLANGYYDSSLYDSLLSALSNYERQNTVYVPIRRNSSNIIIEESKKDLKYILIQDKCFSTIDRFLYYSKQRNIFNGIKSKVNIDEYQCVHAHTLFSAGYIAMQIKMEFGLPYIVAVRNVDLNIFFRKMVHLRNKGVQVLKEADKVVFLSSVYKEAVIEHYVPKKFREEIYKKSVVIPNGINDIFLDNVQNRKSLSEGKVSIIYAGDIDNNKNISMTVDACRLLIKKGYHCTFNVVGEILEMPYSSFLNEDFIHYFPKCSQKELIKYYRANDIFVMPSHMETFGMVYAEAMSQGLPVIYTRGQGFDGHFDDGVVGYSVSDKDAGELVEKIEMIIKDYDDMSKRCIEGSKRFNWKKIAEKYKDMYMEITA